VDPHTPLQPRIAACTDGDLAAAPRAGHAQRQGNEQQSEKRGIDRYDGDRHLRLLRLAALPR